MLCTVLSSMLWNALPTGLSRRLSCGLTMAAAGKPAMMKSRQVEHIAEAGHSGSTLPPGRLSIVRQIRHHQHACRSADVSI